MAFNPKLAKYLREKRVEVGLTQPDLAKALKLGSAMSISNFEKGKAPVPDKHLKRLVKVLKLNPQMVVNLIQEERVRQLKKILKMR